MKITAHQPIEGVQPGQTVDVDDERGNWLLTNGYASKAAAGPDKPNVDDRKDAWVAYAQAMGDQDADSKTKAELIKQWADGA